MLYNPTSLENIPVRPWWEVEDSKGTITVKVPTLNFVQFLGILDYRQAYLEDRYQIVRIQNNVITPVKDTAEIIAVALKWLDNNATGQMIGKVYKDQIKSAWINKTPQLFSPTNLKFLPKLTINLQHDTKTECYLYFQNTVVKITKDRMETIAYADLNAHVLTEQIVKRDFSLKKLKRLFRHTPYARFVYNISNKNLGRFKTFISIIGYMLHRFQVPSNARAIILLDQTINELSAACGGSGKTVFTKALGHLRNLCEIPGKDFDSGYTFSYQRVTPLTNIISINDIRASLNFEHLFGRITDGFTINRKYKPEVFIEFSRSPKMILASNYLLKEPSGNSSERRKLEVELSDHYGKDRTIYDDFGHFFFEDWTDGMWNDFTLFMSYCVQYYLRYGLVEAPQINLLQRRIITEIGIELLEYLDEKFATKSKHHKKELFKEFITGDYVGYKYRPTARTFTVKLKKYLDYKGFDYQETPSNTKAFIEIVAELDHANQITIDDVDTDYRTVDTPNKMTRMVNVINEHFAQEGNNAMALDFETTGLDVFTDEPVSLALSFHAKSGFNIKFPSNASERNKLIEPLLPFLMDSSITKVFHNAKFDLKFFHKIGIELAGEIADTMVMDYLLDPSRKQHGLKEISKLHLNYMQIEFDQMLDGKAITEVDDKTLTDYACEDADLTLQLYHYLTNKLQ